MSILIFPTLLRLSSRDLLPSSSICLNFYLRMRATCPSHPILLHFITLKYLVNSTSYEAPHYVVFSILMPLQVP